MCAMGFAPKSNGEAIPYQFTEPKLKNFHLDEKTLLQLRHMVYKFWKSVAEDPHISDELQTFLA